MIYAASFLRARLAEMQLALVLRWSALTALASKDSHHAAVAIVAIAIASRAGLAPILALMPAARSDGLGHAAGGATGARAAVAVAIGLLALTLLLGLPAAL